MKNIVILHGAGETKNSFWLPYAERESKRLGYQVSIPELPDTDNPDLAKWLPRAQQEKFDEETILIGHSSGCPLILSILENVKVRVRKAILVAGFSTPLPDGPTKILQRKYDWEKIKNNCREFIFINSDNDPWGCDDKQGRNLYDHLGGTLIIWHQGHMGSDTFKQPYKEFPFLMKLLD
jgi:hypothetical protein